MNTKYTYYSKIARPLLALSIVVSSVGMAEAATETCRDSAKVKIETRAARRAGKNIVLTMRLGMDSLKLKSDMLIAYTPFVSDGTNTARMRPVLITGRNEHYRYLREGNKSYPDAEEVWRRKGSKGEGLKYEYSYVMPFEEWMDGARLYVDEDLCGCGDELADNTLVGLPLDFDPTKNLLTAFVTPQVEAQKVREEKGSAFIDFPVDKIVLYPDYRKNPRELAKIIETIEKVKKDKNLTITHIDIHGYASPESPYDHNAWLAENRAKTLKNYVRNLMSMDNSLFSVSSTPEDWAGLKKYVSESNISNKEAILDIVNSDMKPDPKEWKIKKTYPTEYRFMLSTWYPALRHSDYVITYTVRPFTVEEAKEILKTKPKQLSLNEMFMVAQTYKPGSAEYNNVFATAARMFPEDETACLNAANIALNNRDFTTAEHFLKKAGSSPQADLARGTLALLKHDYTTAEQLLQKAADAGIPEASNNLKILEQMKAMGE